MAQATVIRTRFRTSETPFSVCDAYATEFR